MIRRAIPLWSLLLAATLLGSCLDAPTAPHARGGSVALAPRFAHAIAAGLVDVISVRVSLRRPGSSVAVVDSVIVFPVGSDEVELRLTAPVNGASEEFELFLAMMNATGDTVFRSGPVPVTLTTSAEPTVVEPELVYSGPGANATAVRFVEPPTLVNFGDTVVIVAEAVDAQQNPIAGTPIGLALADSADTLRARVTDARAGRLVVGEVRGPVVVRAFTPADLGATHAITVQPVPSGVEVVSGDAQSATVATALAAPLVARVIAADGLGVEGVEVVFAVTSGNGSLSIAAASSDANGEVATVLTVGVEPGPQTVRAFVAGVPDFFVEFNATAAAGAPTQLSFAVQPVSGTADAALTAVAVHVLDANGFLVDTSSRVITMTLGVDPTGQNPLGGTLNVAAVNGVAVFDDLAIGIAATGYQLDASAAGVTSVQSNPFDVAAGAATQLAFAAPPPPAVPVDVPFDVELVARDAGGNLATAFAGTVTLAVAGGPGGATLGGTTGVQAVAGVASFTGLTLDVLGTGYALTAGAPGLTGATSDPFNVEPPPEVNAWTNVTGGNWNVAANWSRGTVPTGTDTVWIRQPGTYTVIVNDTRTIGPVLMGATSGRQTLSIPGSAVTLGDTVVLTASADVVISGGSVGGTGSMLVGGNLTWTGGNLSTSGTVAVQPSGTVTISGATGRNLQNGVLAIGGTATWAGTHTINAGSEGRLRVLAGGAMDIVGDPSLLYNLGGLPSRIENFGTVRRTTSTGLANITAAFDNSGALIVEAGSLQLGGGGTSGGSIEVQPNALLSFTGGTHALSATSTLQLNGRVAHGAGTTTVEGAWSGPGRLQVSGGIFNYSAATGSVDSLVVSGGTLGGAAGTSLTVATAMTWTDGNLTTSGTVTVQPTGTVTISGATGRNLQNGVLAIGGTAIWDGTHTINSGSEGRLRVLAGGTMDIVGDPSMLYNLGGLLSRIENFGTVRRTTSAGVANITAAFDNSGALIVEAGSLQLGGGGTSGGSIEVQPNALLSLTAGTHALSATSSLQLDGRVAHGSATTTVEGAWSGPGRLQVAGGTLNYSVASGSVDSLVVSGGTLGGAIGSSLNVATTMTWTGGNLTTSGTVTVQPTATLAISGTTGRNLQNGVLAIGGTAIWDGTHTINAGSEGRLRVLTGGELTITGDPSMLYNLGGIPSRIENFGTVRRTTSAGVVLVTGAFDNVSAVEVESGTLRVSGGGASGGSFNVLAGAILDFGGGTHTLNAESAVSGSGQVRVAAGSVAASGPWNVAGVTAVEGGTLNYSALGGSTATLNLSGGTLGGATGGALTVSAAMNWTGGNLSGTGGSVLVPVGATVDISGATGRNLAGMTLEVLGAGTWSGTHTINSGSASRLLVSPSGTLVVSGDPTITYNLGGATPSFEVLGTVTRTTSTGDVIINVPFTLNAPLNVQTGTWELRAGGALNAPVTVAGEALLLLTSGTHTMQPTFGVSGGGGVRLAGGTLTGLAAADTVLLNQVELAGGTLTVSPGGVVQVGGTLQWGGTTLNGAGTIFVPLAAALDVATTATRTLTATTIDVFGTMTVSAAATINTGSAARLIVQPGALLEFTHPAASSASIPYNLGGAAPLVDVRGEVRLSTAASLSFGVPVDLSGIASVNAGTLNLTGGSTLTGSIVNAAGANTLLNGGTHTMANGASMVGAGVTALAGGAVTTATATDTASISTLNLTGGSLTQPGTLVFGALNWSGGASITGTGTTSVMTTLALTGTAARNFSSGTIENRGTGTRSGTFALNTGSGARFVNYAVYDWSGDGSHLYSLGGAVPVFENLGTFQRNGATGASVATLGAQLIDTVSTAFDVNVGELHLTGGGRLGGAPYLGGVLHLAGGTFSMRTGTTWSADGGLLRLSTGLLTADSGAVIAMPDFDMTGGALTHEATLSFPGGFGWSGGTISSNDVGLGGATRLVGGGSWAVSGAGTKTIQGLHRIEIDALSNVSFGSGAIVNAGGGPVIVNAGDFAVAGPGTLAWNLGGSAPRFENLGTGTVRTIAPVSGAIDWPFSNDGGLLQVTNDSLRLTRGSVGAFYGDFIVESGALVLNASNPFTLTGAVTVAGAGGDLVVAGDALEMVTYPVSVTGDLTTRGNGRLTMTSPTANLFVDGNATFNGGLNVMSAGTFQLGGNFTQGGATTAFAPGGTHRTVLAGSVVDQRIAFAVPSANYFNRLEIQAQERGIVLDTDVRVIDSLVMLAGAVNYSLVGAGTSQRLRVDAGLRLAQATGNPLLAPPVLELVSAPSIAPTAAGSGMAPDTTVYFGATMTVLPTALGIRYNSIRLSNAQVVMPSGSITGDLHVTSGSAAFGGNTTFTIGGKLRTTESGSIAMTDPTANVTVADSAIFAGGTTTGLLTAGLLRLQGDFVQGGATTSSFRATGPHRTEFAGGVQQNVTMVNAGAGATNSRFAILELGRPMVSGANLQLQTDVFAAFLRDTTTGFVDVIGSSVGALLSADTAWATNTRFNGTRFALTGGGPLTTLSSLTFENMDPTSTYLYVDLNEAFQVFISGVTFTTAPTTGYYLHANQLNQSATPSAATLALIAPVNPADPGGRYLRTSSVGGILPAVTWLGVLNP